MKYLVKSDTLYQENGSILCALKRSLFSQEKQICQNDGTPLLRLLLRQDTPEQADVRTHTYILEDPQGRELAAAYPGYAQGEDPGETGWPLHRMPRADHARVELQGQQYQLTMLNSQNYVMQDPQGQTVLQVIHRGLMGGWTLDWRLPAPPEILCGIYGFCRFLERENEWLVI